MWQLALGPVVSTRGRNMRCARYLVLVASLETHEMYQHGPNFRMHKCVLSAHVLGSCTTCSSCIHVYMRACTTLDVFACFISLALCLTGVLIPLQSDGSLFCDHGLDDAWLRVIMVDYGHYKLMSRQQQHLVPGTRTRFLRLTAPAQCSASKTLTAETRSTSIHACMEYFNSTAFLHQADNHGPAPRNTPTQTGRESFHSVLYWDGSSRTRLKIAVAPQNTPMQMCRRPI